MLERVSDAVVVLGRFRIGHPIDRTTFLAGTMLAFAWLGAYAAPAYAEGTLQRIRTDRVLHCALEPRPGFAEASADGEVKGLGVDLCRAVAIAVLDPTGRVEVSLPESGNEFDPLRRGTVDLAFLSADTMDEQNLMGSVLPGPIVFIDPIAVMVPASSPAQSPKDMNGATVCLMIGSPGQRALEATLGDAGVPFSRFTFEEDVEMLDAYNVGNCNAVVEQETRLAEIRKTNGVNHLQSRILAPPLALTPVYAATPNSDGAWSALVAEVVQAVLATGASQSRWRAPSFAAIPTLRAGWLADVRAALGTYADMRERHIGAQSPLRLPAWPNALWPDGLLLGMAPN